MLTKQEFDVLMTLIEGHVLSKQVIAKEIGCSIDDVNEVLNVLISKNYYDGQVITNEGFKALEPYRVKRAIFLAAGFGSRLVPITLNTPKPLIRVFGKRLIDTLLDAVVKVGIEEIIIVRGYLGEQFDQLKSKYPQIKFIDNPIYNETNNISSAYCVRNLFQGAYVLESDLLLKNPNLIRKYEYSTNFLGIPVQATDDWFFRVDENGTIVEQGVGGRDCYQMVGISYWSEADGTQLEKDIEEVFFSLGGKERYWEQTALKDKKDNYKIQIRKCKLDDIIEIDTFSELKAIDKVYAV